MILKGFFMKRFTALLLICLSLFCVSGCKTTENKPTKYQIVAYLDNDALKCSMKIETYMPDDLNELWFNLFFNAYRNGAEYFAVEGEYMPLTPKYGYGEITSVSDNRGELEYQLCEDMGLLKVFFGKKYLKGQKITLFIDFLVVLSNFNHRLSMGEQTVNLGNFYPILCVYENGFVNCPYYDIGDPFYSQVADYEVQFSCGGEYSVASSGECIGVEVGQTTTYTFAVKKVRDFAITLSKNFSIAKSTQGGVEITYYYLNGDSQEVLRVICDCLNFFSEKFYPYPYKTYSVAQSDFCYGGMEYPCLSLINKTLPREENLWSIVHETAHQWWYAIVGNNQITNACLDEGLAELSTNLFFANYPKYNISAKKDLLNKGVQYAKFSAFYKSLYGQEYNFSPLRSLGEYKNSLDYTNTIYLYTPYALSHLVVGMGQDEFCSVLSDFANKYAYNTANVKNFTSFFSGANAIYLDLVYQGKSPLP